VRGVLRLAVAWCDKGDDADAVKGELTRRGVVDCCSVTVGIGGLPYSPPPKVTPRDI